MSLWNTVGTIFFQANVTHIKCIDQVLRVKSSVANLKEYCEIRIWRQVGAILKNSVSNFASVFTRTTTKI